jgi:hypothetical protein
VLWCPLRFQHKNNDLPPFFVAEFMSYLCYLCLYAYSDVQRIVLLYVFTFFVPCCDVHYDFCIKSYSVQLFVGKLMSFLCYLYLFAYIGVKHVLTIRVMMVSVLIRDRNCLPFTSALGSPTGFGVHVLLIFLVFCVVLFVFVLSCVPSVASVLCT